MGTIHVLDAELSNQIAAGEVVDRPASVVKELVENALDAQSSRVTVEVVGGGRGRISVIDDGMGMDEHDLSLCLERHATSKIRSISELYCLPTFGFRGEALPSIASVSRLTLASRPRHAPEGHELVTEGGRIVSSGPYGGAEGTRVDVRDLFWNVPAREKFQKGLATEVGLIGGVLEDAALSRPDVSFLLLKDGKRAREYLRVSSRQQRAEQLLEGETLSSCEAERGPVTLQGYLAPPERARPGTTGLHLLVNNRPVRDRLLARAVAQAYGSVLPSGRYPIGVVFVDLPPELVDVNVHPQKAEVRFADPRFVYDTVTRELHRLLSREFSLPAFGSLFGAASGRLPPSGFPTQGPSARPPPFEPMGFLPGASEISLAEVELAPDRGPMNPGSGEPPLAALAEAPPALASGPAFQPRLFASDPTLPKYGALRFVGQVRRMFLVCESDNGLVVLDQHAAAERVTFHKLRAAYGARTVAMQRLLLPELVDLPRDQVAYLEAHAAELLAMGLEVRAVSEGAVALHGVPQLLRKAPPVDLVLDWLSESMRFAKRPFSDVVDLIFATLACHGSVRAGDDLSADEARHLLTELDAVDFSGHCPHGRPVVTELPFSELCRRVGR